MKELLKQLAPTTIFAIIVVAMLTTTLNTLNSHVRKEGIQHAEVVGRLDLVDYRLDKLDTLLCTPVVTTLHEEVDDGG